MQSTPSDAAGALEFSSRPWWADDDATPHPPLGTACHHDCEEMILDMQQMNVAGGAAVRRVEGSVSDQSAESQAYLFLPATVLHAQGRQTLCMACPLVSLPEPPTPSQHTGV
jgi:hypothetical protein